LGAIFSARSRAASTSTRSAVSTAVDDPSTPPNHSRMVCESPIDTVDWGFDTSPIPSRVHFSITSLDVTPSSFASAEMRTFLVVFVVNRCSVCRMPVSQ